MPKASIACAFLLVASPTFSSNGVAVQETIPAAAASEGGAREFTIAMQRVAQHLPDGPDSPALDAFILYDYLVAARLRRDLTSTPGVDLDSKIDAFLHVHVGEPVARALRHDWLLNLADRKRWEWFLPRSIETTDAELACDRLAGRLATGDTVRLASDALARWSMVQKQPDECAPVFAWLRTQDLLTPALADARTRAALTADNARLARQFVADVPPTVSAPVLQWLQLLETPRPAVAALAAAQETPVEADALVSGFTRLSVSDAVEAWSRLPRLLERPDMNPLLQNRLRRAVALGSAYSRSPHSVAAFGGLTPDANDAPVQEWRVRAALWAGDYRQALKWMLEMPPALAAQPRWRYWRARSVAATSGDAAAAPLYSEIAGMRDYYGYLAADRLSQAYNLNIHRTRDDVDAQASLAAEPGLARAHALFDCDMADDAGAEWTQVLGNAKAALKIQAARLAASWGWYAQTIATLAQAGEWDDVPLRYPRPYAAIVAEAGEQEHVPEDWLFAIMRQESLFRKDALSRADARGLMQMQPATASALARRLHFAVPSRDALFDPAVGVKLGAIYGRELLDRYKGQLILALAAYNAGPVSVARWMPGAGAVDADIWIENIPYTETRSYVQHILEHIVAFAAVRDATPPRLDTLLLPIDPSALAAQ